MNELTDGWMNFHQAVSPSLPILLYPKFMDFEVRLPLPSCITLKLWVSPPGRTKRILSTSWGCYKDYMESTHHSAWDSLVHLSAG